MNDLREGLQELAEAAARHGQTRGPRAALRQGRRRRLRLAGGTATLLALVLLATMVGADRLAGRQSLLTPATTSPDEVQLPVGSPPGPAGEQMVQYVASTVADCPGGDPDGPTVLVAWGTAHGRTWLIVAKPPRPGENWLCWAAGRFNAGRMSGGTVLVGGPGPSFPLKPLQIVGGDGQPWGQVIGAVTKRATRVRVTFRQGIAPLELDPIQAGDRIPVNFFVGFYRQPSMAKREWLVTRVVAYDKAGAKIAECRAAFPYPSC